MKVTVIAALAALGAAVSGCATIIEGTTQSVSVNTTPKQGAACTLTNSQGTWYVTSPGSVTVHKTKTDLDVTCRKDGYEPGHVVATSHFGATTAGNIIAGGVVGIGVDAASGANFYYDSLINVPLGAPNGIAAAADDAPSLFPIKLRCISPEVAGVYSALGSPGAVTAQVRFNINSGGDPAAVNVTQSSDGVCTVSANPGTTFANVSFDIAADQSWTAGGQPAREIEKHVSIVERVPQKAGGSYTFTVKAKDAAQGKITLDFPVRYR
jgi:hypothetical protein